MIIIQMRDRAAGCKCKQVVPMSRSHGHGGGWMTGTPRTGHRCHLFSAVITAPEFSISILFLLFDQGSKVEDYLYLLI